MIGLECYCCNWSHSVGLLWTSDQPDAETSTWQRTTLTADRHRAPGGIRTRNPSKRAASNPRLRPRDGRDRRWVILWMRNWKIILKRAVAEYPRYYLGIYLEERRKTTKICPRFVPSIIDEWVWYSHEMIDRGKMKNSVLRKETSAVSTLCTAYPNMNIFLAVNQGPGPRLWEAVRTNYL
jgi:hypothetical protein